MQERRQACSWLHRAHGSLSSGGHQHQQRRAPAPAPSCAACSPRVCPGGLALGRPAVPLKDGAAGAAVVLQDERGCREGGRHQYHCCSPQTGKRLAFPAGGPSSMRALSAAVSKLLLTLAEPQSLPGSPSWAVEAELKGKPQFWQPLVEGQVSSLRPLSPGGRWRAAAAGPAASSTAAARSRIAATRGMFV